MSNDFLRPYTIPTLQNQEKETPSTQTSATTSENITVDSCSHCLPPGIHGNENGTAEVFHFMRKRPRSEEIIKTDKPTSTQKSIAISTGRDPSYPDELNLLINPLSCELCKVQLSSKNTAISHFESKNHDRKLTAWLSEHYLSNAPPIKRFVKNGPSGPEALRCEICDLPLTSIAHAQQHFAGRKHRLVAQNKTYPSGNGYYDAEGKWVRTETKKFPSLKNTDSRFGIGQSFVAAKETPSSKQELESPKTNSSIPESLHCKICNVFVTAESQMTTHLDGARHKKKCAATEAIDRSVSVQSEIINGNSILATINKESNPAQDFSMYRTPTGSYYCQICNLTMTHETVLQQHIQGKKHNTKAKTNPEKN